MKRTRTAVVALAVALLALSLGLAACGEKSEDVTGESQPLSLTLDFYPNPDHAGIYMAQKLGYFEEAGLDVSIHTPADPAAPIKLVAAGQTDLAISYEPEVLLAREQGLDVVAVGALVNRPLTSMIWLKKSGIKGVGGLRGKTIATAGIPYQDAYLKTILARANLTPSDVKAVNVGFGLLPALVGGSAQAMLGGFSNVEGVDLRAARPSSRSSPRSTSSACLPTTSSSSSPSAKRWKKTRRSSDSSWPRWRAGRRPRPPIPKRRPKRCSKRTPTSTRS